MGDNESFTEVTSQSWFSRLGQSIKSVGTGLIIFIASFFVLFWNESSAVKNIHGIEEGQSKVVSLAEPKVDSSKNGQLVHLSGDAVTTDTVTDPVLGVSETAIRLIRTVEMYQWKETSSSSTKKKLGGGQETVTTYNYVKDWSSSVVNSSSFKRPDGHQNPGAMEIPSETFNASNVNVGDFTLPAGLINQISQAEPVQVTQDKLPGELQGRAKASGSEVYVGYNPSSPQIGDLRIKLTVVKPQKVSIVAVQQGNSFSAYQPKEGHAIMWLNAGVVPATQMFQQAASAEGTKTWLFRLLGFIMMYAGIAMVFKPIVTFGDVVPFVGSILNFGIGIFAFIVAAALSLVTIAIAWLFARPLLGIALLVVGMGGFVAFKVLGKKKAAA
ncbi:MAG: TMEM43 family protein [Spirochaetes bacterium]|nr:TMEM43 family protein [Spirochaetota bacterium]